MNMSWRQTGNRPWQDRYRRGRGGRGNNTNRWEDWSDRRSRPWRSQSKRHTPLRTKIYQSHQDESSDEEVRAEKLKTASLVKSRLNSLTVADKSESMKQLLVTSAQAVLKEAPTDTKEAVSVEKESRRIAHVPKPIKPVPPPPILPPLLAEHLDFGADLEGPSHIMPQRIERKLLQDLISMPISELKKMVERPTSKDNLLFKDLMKNTRVSLSDAMRKLAEHKLQNFGLENPFTELENLVDPDLAVDVCAKPVETIQALMEIFNLNLDGEYDNMGIQAMPEKNIPNSESIESPSVESFIKNESLESPYQWHSPCSIETNKSFLGCFNEGSKTESNKSFLTFTPEIKMEDSFSILENGESYNIDCFVNTLGSPNAPQPVPPPEPLDIIMERSKRAIDINRLNEQITDSINILKKMATVEHKKLKQNYDESNSPVQSFSGVLNSPLLSGVSQSQFAENAPTNVGIADTPSAVIKTLPSDTSTKSIVTSLKSSSHKSNHNYRKHSACNQEIVKNALISVSTQTYSVGLKDSSTQRYAQKLISRSTQAFPISLPKCVQTSFNVAHASIQTHSVSLKNTEVQTDSNHIIAPNSTQSKCLVDKHTQHTVALSHRGEQTNHIYITSNKYSQTKLQEVPNKNKNDILAKKRDENQFSCPKCKESAYAANNLVSLGSLAKAPAENTSLIGEFSILQNDIKALATGSLLRRRLISSVLDVMSSTFINFYNLFNEVDKNSKSQELKENRNKSSLTLGKNRIRTRSPLHSKETERKKIKLENPKTSSSQDTNSNNVVKGPQPFNSIQTIEIEHNNEKGFKREIETETEISAKKRVKEIKKLNVERAKKKSQKIEDEIFNKLSKNVQSVNISTSYNLEENEINAIANRKKEISENNSNEIQKNEKSNPRPRSNGGVQVNDPRPISNSVISGDEPIKVFMNDNNVVTERKISPSHILQTDDDLKRMFHLRECYVKCSKVNVPPTWQSGPASHPTSSENNADTQLGKTTAHLVPICVHSESSHSSHQMNFTNDPVCKLERNEDPEEITPNSEVNVMNDPVCKLEKNEDPEEIIINSEPNLVNEPVCKLERIEEPEEITNSELNLVNELVCKLERNEDAEEITLNSEHEKSVTTASELSFQDLEETKKKITSGQIEFVGHNKPVSDFKVSGNHVLAASDNLVFCFSFKTGKRKRMYSGHKSSVTCLSLLAKKGGEVVFSGSYDQVIHAFSVQNSSLLCSSPELGGVPQSLISQGTSILNGDLYTFLDNGVFISFNPKTLKVKNKFKIGNAPLLCAAVAEINFKKIVFISTENCEIVSKEIESDIEPLKLDWELGERAERLVYFGKSLYCGSKLPNITVFNFASDVVSKSVIDCLGDSVGLCIVEHWLLVGSQMGKFKLIDMTSQTRQAEFSKDGNFKLLAVHKKMVIGSTIDGKLIAMPLPQKVRKILQV